MAEPPKKWQPLHPAIRPLLDPQYVAIHDQHMVYVKPDHLKPWDASARTAPSLFNGCQPVVPVGSTQDVTLGAYNVRVYRPEKHDEALPVFVWFHGGGWAIGGVGDNADLLTRICSAPCVVVSVGYRLAPEHPFPAALVDSLDALRWVNTQPAELGTIDTTRISVGGLSAGGNLAIAVALAAANPGAVMPSVGAVDLQLKHPLASCVLVVPVIDNTATVDGVWKGKAETAPWLTAERMLWYRRMYFQSGQDGWDASPNYAADELLKRLCPTKVFYSEFDLLADEAVVFAGRLQQLGVKAEMEMIEGGTHSILVLSAVVERGRRLIDDIVKLWM